jgi:hypothetical protein
MRKYEQSPQLKNRRNPNVIFFKRFFSKIKIKKNQNQKLENQKSNHFVNSIC